ncbi:unnamed protein product [Amoebophrya sp. A120]|nr:unnamed protein product [Amoebophrya sp. A120]|eukprot:GSA120T00009266001.1
MATAQPPSPTNPYNLDQEMQSPVGNPAQSPAYQVNAESTRNLILSETQIDAMEETDPHSSFRNLRRKVMYVSLASSFCCVIHGVLNYWFQVDTQLEIMRIIDNATGNPSHHKPHEPTKAFLFIFFAGLPAVAAGISIGLLVPMCGYFGAKWVNQSFLCMFFSCNTCGLVGSLLGFVMTLWIMLAGIPGVDHWVAHCDPVPICCKGIGGEANCDAATGLPFPQFEKEYRDCILGAHLQYERKYPDSYHLDPARCDPTVKLLLKCEHFHPDPENALEHRFDNYEKQHPHWGDKWGYNPQDEEHQHPPAPLPTMLAPPVEKSPVAMGLWGTPRHADLFPVESIEHARELRTLAEEGLSEEELRRILADGEGDHSSSVQPSSFVQQNAEQVQNLSDRMKQLFHQLPANKVHDMHKKPIFGPNGVFKNPEAMKEHLKHGKDFAKDKAKHFHPEDQEKLVDQLHDMHLEHHHPAGFDHWPAHLKEHLPGRFRPDKYNFVPHHVPSAAHFDPKKAHVPTKEGVMHGVHKEGKKHDPRGKKVDVKGLLDQVFGSHNDQWNQVKENVEIPQKIEIPENFPKFGPNGEQEFRKGASAVSHSLNQLTSGDEEKAKKEMARLYSNGKHEWKTKIAKRHDKHHHWEPTFETCRVNPKAVRLMHAVHNNLESLVPKMEFLCGAKLLTSIPFIFFIALGALYGFRMWRVAKRGYRPTYFEGAAQNLQLPLYRNQHLIGGPQMAMPNYIVTAPMDHAGNGYQMSDQQSAYQVQYPALSQSMAQDANGAPPVAPPANV